jgi:hypothetical protein
MNIALTGISGDATLMEPGELVQLAAVCSIHRRPPRACAGAARVLLPARRRPKIGPIPAPRTVSQRQNAVNGA